MLPLFLFLASALATWAAVSTYCGSCAGLGCYKVTICSICGFMTTGSTEVLARSKSRLLAQVSERLRNGSIELPSLPDVAIEVRVAVANPDLEINDLVRLIQQDPGLSAYLMKVSLSAVYSRGNKITGLQSAINRLGLNLARDLTMSYALKTLFSINDPAIKREMRECWQRSVHTAALSYVLAKHCGFDPERAMLAGLLQDIGALPLLSNLKAFPELLNSATGLKQLIHEFTGKIGSLVLHKWAFDSDLIATTLYREDWLHDSQSSKTLVDLVLIARFHTYLNTSQHRHLPKLHDLPAFHKLGLGSTAPSVGVEFLLQARREVDELRSLFQ